MNEADILRVKQRFGIIGNSPLLNHAINVAIQVAPTDMTVLITGESGSGKESFSKIIHQLSARKHGQFIAVNCGAIPEGTIDSELFGHEKGSFTGAIEARKGYFEVTNKGTIFLDEVAELPLNTQARLLRVLEEGDFIKVGSSKVLKTDVRVVAATNIALEDAVDKGTFRKDLYYRLNTVPIFVPPLRQRGSDIDLIFRKFAGDFSEKYKTKPVQLTPDAKDILLRFSFPGNIRQLKNIVEQVSVLEFNKTIDADTLRKYLPQTKSIMPVLYSGQQDENLSERDILYKVLFDLKKDVVDLKKLVHDIITHDEQPGIGKPAIKDYGHLLQSVPEEKPQSQEPESVVIDLQNQPPSTYSLDRVEDISHEYEDDDSLSIEKKEKELIIKALRKNSNKRKYAAQDLGISERTLYRKIKQYEIDD
ncbi:MAG: sigma-54-dependent Fis family transcriptional regulator [Bacteroidetes bacterium]|nr:MAG: sigma-54-dependent Fis family transcriptional regulator [Bacteroidota bacterium]